MINQSLNLLPNTSEATAPPPAQAAKLYQRVQGSDPERSAGSQVHYNSFADFVTTFEIEAKDPKTIGAADVLDIINPLQHLPIIGQIYREMTDDQIKPCARMMGGAVFGGAVGLATSSVNAVVEEETGKDVPSNIITAMAGDDPFASQKHKPNIKAGDAPQDQLNALLTGERADVAAHRKAASFYREVAAAAGPDLAQIVMMNDPERTAGTFYSYA
jgi:hypothetical protein